jgi:hypothetical protein
MTPKLKAEVDYLVDEIFGKFRSSEKGNMLRTNYIKGMTNLTMLTADEQAGIALTILIISQLNKGRELFEKMFADAETDLSDTESEDSNLISKTQLQDKCTYPDFVQLLEVLLSFHAWYKSPTPIDISGDDVEYIKESIKDMMKMILQILPRKDGHGWNIQKFHELLHIAEDIKWFGSPKNFDTGIMENRLIHVGKQHAKSIQKRGTKIFTKQLGNRIHTQQCLEKCKRYIDRFHNDFLFKEDENENESVISDLSSENGDDEYNKAFNFSQSGDYTIQKIGGRLRCYWNTRTKAEVHPSLIKFTGKNLLKEEGSAIVIYTEVKINNLIFRCHPNYRGNGEWYDYGMVDYKPSRADLALSRKNELQGIRSAFKPGHYPAKILGFFWKVVNGNVLFILVKLKQVVMKIVV